MSIPLELLQKWAKPGKNEMSKQTYAVLKQLLLERLDKPQPNIYLQGSYRNSTNVKDNSDIDIVVEFDPFINITALKQYVFSKIDNINNFHFSMGSKTVKYKGLKNRHVPADIVPCMTVKGKEDCVMLYDSSRGMIIYNYPKVHIRNGEEKSGSTDGNYKKAVRMMKNARNFLQDRGVSANVSSFAIECILYNTPDDVFSGNEFDVFYKVLKWLIDNKGEMPNMYTQDEKFKLFSFPNISINSVNQFIDNVVKLWNHWDDYQK